MTCLLRYSAACQSGVDQNEMRPVFPHHAGEETKVHNPGAIVALLAFFRYVAP
jgi:hypothetical protein